LRLREKNTEDFVNKILDEYTLIDYVNAKGGLDNAVLKINQTIDASNINLNGKKILEFGAGICKLSAVISARFSVNEIWCLDQTEQLLREIAPRVIKIINGDLSKFRFINGDMNSAFELNEKFDAIIWYGAVHHLHLHEYFYEQI
jgi:hypothetical protein